MPQQKKDFFTNSNQLRSALSGDLSFVPHWYGSSVPTYLLTTCWDLLQLPSTIDYSQLACLGSSLATQVESRIWRLTRLMNLQVQYSCFFGTMKISFTRPRIYLIVQYRMPRNWTCLSCASFFGSFSTDLDQYARLMHLSSLLELPKCNVNLYWWFV